MPKKLLTLRTNPIKNTKTNCFQEKKEEKKIKEGSPFFEPEADKHLNSVTSEKF